MKWEHSCGAVLYTWRDGVPYYCLVHDTGRGFPKGHMEGTEMPRQTALREIKEETGIDAALDNDFCEIIEYDMAEKPGTRKRVTYFLGSFFHQTVTRQESEISEVRLVPFAEAYRLLTHDAPKEILKKANEALLHISFDKAEAGDLPRVTALYERIVQKMCADGLQIWDDVYPRIQVGDDIQKGQLYLLCSGEKLWGAAALCKEENAVCVERLGVAPDARGRGLAQLMLVYAEIYAKAQGADTLRLFSVRENAPAAALYEKAGFGRDEKIYELPLDDGTVLQEYKFEKRL